MKKILVLFAILFFIKVSAQQTVTIHFRNGEKLMGLAKIKSNGDIIIEKNKKKEIYNYKNAVRRVTVYNGSEKIDCEYKIVGSGEYETVKLLQIAIEGEVSLYEDVYSGITNPATTGGFTMNYSSVTYYISKRGSNKAINLRIGTTYSRRFRNIAKEFFKDCDDLIEKINTKSYFKRYGIASVVEYYNKNCSN